MKFTVYWYTTSSGRVPPEEFLTSLDEDTAQEVTDLIDDFKDAGFNIPAPDLKKLAGEKDLWELRVKYAGNIYRILLAPLNRHSAILLHAFQKKTQKTPRKEIKTAHKRLQISKKYGEV